MGNTLKTRTVSRTDPIYGAYTAYLNSKSTGTRVQTYEEAISYSDRGREFSNTCEHTFTRKFFPEDTVAQHRYRSYKVANVVDSFNTYIPRMTQPSLDVDSEEDFLFRKERAITDVLAGGIRATVDIPLFIGELKDSKMLITTLLKGAQDAQRVYGYIKKAQAIVHAYNTGGFWTESRADKMLLAWYRNVWCAGRLTLKSAADVNLWYKFGLAPLMSDIPTLWRCLNKTEIVVRRKQTVDKKIRADVLVGPNQTLAGYGHGDRQILVKATATLSGSPAYNSASAIGSASMPSKLYRQYRHKYTVYGQLVCPQLNAAEQIMRSIRLGAGSPISVGYALIPYSFILERFIHIGELMRDAERRVKALDFGLEFKDGIWESYERSYVETVPWWTFEGSTLKVLSRTSGSASYEDTLRYRWVGWKDVNGGVVYKRQPLPDRKPKFRLRFGGKLNRLFRWDTDLALLSKFL